MNYPADKPKFIEHMQYTSAAYGMREAGSHTLRGYWHALQDIDVEIVCSALRRSVSHHERMPTAVEVRKICNDIQRKKRADEEAKDIHAAPTQPAKENPVKPAPEFTALADAWQHAAAEWGLHPDMRPKSDDIGKEFFRQFWATWKKVDERHAREWADGTRRKWVGGS